MALQGKPPTVPGSNPAQVGAGWRCVKSEEFGQTFIYGEWTYVRSTRPARSHHRQKLLVKILDHFHLLQARFVLTVPRVVLRYPRAVSTELLSSAGVFWQSLPSRPTPRRKVRPHWTLVHKRYEYGCHAPYFRTNVRLLICDFLVQGLSPRRGARATRWAWRRRCLLNPPLETVQRWRKLPIRPILRARTSPPLHGNLARRQRLDTHAGPP